eukprot:jgi/Mesvir1/23436/Mv22293-RA.1
MGSMENVLLEKLRSYLAENEFEESLNSFLAKHVPKMTFTSVDEEQDLEAHNIYNLFLELFKNHLEKFMAKEGISANELKVICEKVKQTEKNSRFLDAMIASWDYNAFMDLAMGFQMQRKGDDDDDDNEYGSDDD